MVTGFMTLFGLRLRRSLGNPIFLPSMEEKIRTDWKLPLPTQIPHQALCFDQASIDGLTGEGFQYAPNQELKLLCQSGVAGEAKEANFGCGYRIFIAHFVAHPYRGDC